MKILKGIGIAVLVIIGLAAWMGDSIEPVSVIPRPTPVATQPASTTDDLDIFVQFVRDWSDEQPYVTLVDVSTDEELVEIILNACVALDGGMSGRELADGVIAAVDPEFHEDSAVILGAGIGMLCPEHLDEFE